ncbi:hypothetical protein PSSY5922_23245 [Pseudomonas synxantha]
MVVDQLLQRGVQERRHDWLAWYQQQRLVPVLALGDVLGEEPVLHRAEDRPALGSTLVDRGMQAQACDLRQATQGLVLEHILGAEVDVGLACPADHLHGHDGVAAQFEEVIVQPHPLDPEHRLPDGREGFLRVALRSDVQPGRW